MRLTTRFHRGRAWIPQDIALLNPDERRLLRDRAVPEPGAVLREAVQLTNSKRQDIPSIVICTSRQQEEIKAGANQGYSFSGGPAGIAPRRLYRSTHAPLADVVTAGRHRAHSRGGGAGTPASLRNFLRGQWDRA